MLDAHTGGLIPATLTITMSILALNVGSSSIKFALFALAGSASARTLAERLIQGSLTGLRLDNAQLSWSSQVGQEKRTIPLQGSMEDRVDRGIAELFKVLTPWLDISPLLAVGHRVVHGGLDYHHATPIARKVLDDLQSMVSLAPLHEPFNLIGIQGMAKRFPSLPQVACFDTAFHADQPRLHRLYGLPQALSDEGIIRYGFHGLSYEYLRQCIPALLGEMPRRIIMAHLGSGASVAAMKDGVGVGSSLGFSTLDGLVMSTRPGQLDAGVVLYLLQEKGISIADVQRMLYHESGLKGLSGGLSADMHELILIAQGLHETYSSDSEKRQADLAIQVFCHRAGVQMASMLPILSGLDLLVFSGGIGEHSPLIRAHIANQFSWLGVKINEEANQSTVNCAANIANLDSTIPIWVIPTDEEKIIAQHTLASQHQGNINVKQKH